MNIILVRPTDDEDMVDVLGVDHDNPQPNWQVAFERHWDEALNKAKKARPETWDVGEVIKAMTKRRWQIIRLTHSTVTY